MQKLPKHSLFVMVGGDSLNHQASLHHQTKSACNANKHRVTLIDSEIQLAHLTVSLPNIMLQACFITWTFTSCFSYSHAAPLHRFALCRHGAWSKSSWSLSAVHPWMTWPIFIRRYPPPLERISSLHLQPSGISCRHQWVLWISLRGASESLLVRGRQGSAVNDRQKDFRLVKTFAVVGWLLPIPEIPGPVLMSHLNFALLKCSEQLLQGVDSTCVNVNHSCWRSNTSASRTNKLKFSKHMQYFL